MGNQSAGIQLPPAAKTQAQSYNRRTNNMKSITYNGHKIGGFGSNNKPRRKTNPPKPQTAAQIRAAAKK